MSASSVDATIVDHEVCNPHVKKQDSAGFPEPARVLVWFSRGAASAVAAKVAVERYGASRDVEVLYCDTSADEHPDGERFQADVERWIERPIKVLRHPKYHTVEEVWRGEQYIVGPAGASCSRVLKRELRQKYQRLEDQHVFGLTYDEAGRIADLEESHPELSLIWVLVPGRITKEDCYHVLTANGIALPEMYRLGFNNNNCRGCCKGGMGYWNKVRVHFPEVFASRAKVQREIGVGFGSSEQRFYLDELDPEAGRDVPEPPIECGLFCGHYEKLVEIAAGREVA